MSKEQKRKKYQHKQKQQKHKEISEEDRVKNFVATLAQSPNASSALKIALEKTTKG